jgi:hypothetical protein
MCEQMDAMRAVRDAAECLSAACRARRDPTMETLRGVYEAVADEPVPADIARTLNGLGSGCARR